MDIEELIVPLSEEQPAGEDLEYDPDFLELEREAQGSPEKRTGDAVIEAVPPDWKAVAGQALALLERTRDLRVAVHLTNALLRQEGLEGLRDGLSLVGQLSQNLWATVHPTLDEDDGDPTMRCNAIRELSSRENLLQGLLDAPFVSSRVAGRFALRDLKIIAGELRHHEGDERPLPQPQLIEAAFQDAGADAVQEMAAVVGGCVAAAEELQSFYVSQVGSVDAPDLEPLLHDLREIRKCVDEHAARLGFGEAESAGLEDGGAAPAGVAGAATAGAAISGDVRSREDVLRMIDKICLYYRQQEPSSPVPILLRRAASLVNKGFMEIVADLAPAGVSEAERFGVSEEGSVFGVGGGEPASGSSEAESGSGVWGGSGEE